MTQNGRTSVRTCFPSNISLKGRESSITESTLGWSQDPVSFWSPCTAMIWQRWPFVGSMVMAEIFWRNDLKSCFLHCASTVSLVLLVSFKPQHYLCGVWSVWWVLWAAGKPLINSTHQANFMLPKWCHWVQNWEERCNNTPLHSISTIWTMDTIERITSRAWKIVKYNKN